MVVDRRRLVDAIAPAEHVLHGKQHELRRRRHQHFEQRVPVHLCAMHHALHRLERGHLLAIVLGRVLPPHGGRFRIVSPRRGDRYGRVVRRIDKWLALAEPVAFPSENAEPGNTEPRERRAHEIGHDAEILGDDVGA